MDGPPPSDPRELESGGGSGLAVSQASRDTDCYGQD